MSDTIYVIVQGEVVTEIVQSIEQGPPGPQGPEGPPGPGGGISDLTGDVSASGSGSVAATVVLVGGKSAAAVSGAVDEVEAATPSASPSTIVLRDSEGSADFVGITVERFELGNGRIVDEELARPADDPTLLLDLSEGSAFGVPITEASLALSFSNPQPGWSYVLRLSASGVESDVSWPINVTWLNETEVAPEPIPDGKTLLVNLYYDGAEYWGSFAGNYAA